MLDGVRLQLDKAALARTQKLLATFPAVLAGALALALLEIAKVVQAQARSTLRDEGRIDLGALRASLHIVIVNPLTVLVGTNSEYAAPIEFGAKGHFVKVENVPGLREWLVRHKVPDAQDRTYFFVNPKPVPFMKQGWLMGQAMAPTTIEAAIAMAYKHVEGQFK